MLPELRAHKYESEILADLILKDSDSAYLASLCVQGQSSLPAVCGRRTFDHGHDRQPSGPLARPAKHRCWARKPPIAAAPGWAASWTRAVVSLVCRFGNCFPS